ncbi:conserved Plasmodium protein, unknown function [Plasmodium malariae]|uniref:Uncharacterized protein n=1 Tax=Plasmodium malariae TaxID=5858 RepID=A0A1A8WBF1_PLAMA|nr:conserved Plasmodium protein, unknown function [Plasmodium malariae]SBS90345.1 hypothetical protein, conserved [Plasmodium malariae]SCP03296.1 conserved Plasmodium protein, unknown function [Plasmodium malariae]
MHQKHLQGDNNEVETIGGVVSDKVININSKGMKDISNDNLNKSRDHADNYVNIGESYEENLLYTENRKNNNENSSSTCSEKYINIFDSNEKELHRTKNEEANIREKDTLYNSKSKLYKTKKKLSPYSYEEETDYTTIITKREINNQPKKEYINEHSEENNNEDAYNLKGTNIPGDSSVGVIVNNSLILKRKDTGDTEKKCSFSELKHNNAHNEKEKNKKELNNTAEDNENTPSVQSEENGRRNVTISHMGEKEKKKKKNEQNSCLNKQDLIKSLNEKWSDKLNEIYTKKSINIKNIQKDEKIVDHFISPIVKNEVSVQNLKEKKSEIITNFEKFSSHSKKQNNISCNIKNKSTKFFPNNNTNSMNHTRNQNLQEEIIIQKIVLQQNDMNDKVQKTVNSIENMLDETERKNMNNSMRKSKNFNKRRNSEVQNNLSREEEIQIDRLSKHFEFSSSPSSFPPSFPTSFPASFSTSFSTSHNKSSIFLVNPLVVKEEESIDNENLKKGNNLLCPQNIKTEDTDMLALDYNLQPDDSREIQRKMKNIKDSFIYEKLNNTNLFEEKEVKRSNSNLSEKLINIKIYDDSEIDEVDDNESDSFWFNKEVSAVLNKSEYYPNKYLDEHIEGKAIKNGENYNFLGLSSTGKLSMKKKNSNKRMRQQIKRCNSDIIMIERGLSNVLRNRNTFDNVMIRGNDDKDKEIEEAFDVLNRGRSSRCGNTLDKSKKHSNSNDNISCNSIDSISCNSNDSISCNSNSYCRSNNKKKTESMNILGMFENVKAKLARYNLNVDIDRINFKNVDIYQVDFEKLGLNVDNLEKEEKYILLLYISEKKLEYVKNERQTFKRMHSNITQFQSNQKEMIKVKKNSLNNDFYEDCQNSHKGDQYSKKDNTLVDKQNLRISRNDNCTNDLGKAETEVEIVEEERIFTPKCSPENECINERINSSTCHPHDSSLYKIINSHKYIYASNQSNDYNISLKEVPEMKKIMNNNNIGSSGTGSSGTFCEVGLFFEFCRRMIKQYNLRREVSSNINYINEKTLLEKFFKSFIYLFIQDECIDQFLKCYEHVNEVKNVEDSLLKNSLCVEYMCNILLNDSVNDTECSEKDVLNNESLNFPEMMKNIIKYFIINDNLVSKIKEIQIINRILKDEVKTYSIKVPCMDLYFDVEPHFIEDVERVVVGKDVGFFTIQILNHDYTYNYYKNKKETIINDQNNNPIWNFFYGYLNDIYYWYNEKDENALLTPVHIKDGSVNRDMNNSKRLSRNFIKPKKNENKEQQNNLKLEGEYDCFENFVDDKSNDSLKNYEAHSKNDTGDKKNKDLRGEGDKVKSINTDKINEKLKKKCEQIDEAEYIHFIEKNKYVMNMHKGEGANEDETILSSSTKIEEFQMYSNFSSVDNSNCLDSHMMDSNPLQKNHPLGTVDSSTICIRNYTDAVKGGPTSSSNSSNGDSRNDRSNDISNISCKYSRNDNRNYRSNSNTKRNDNCGSTSHGEVQPSTHLEPDYYSTFITVEKIAKCENEVHNEDVAQMVSFQYKGSLPKDKMNASNKICKMNKMSKNTNRIGSYFSSYNNEILTAVHLKNEKVENFSDAHFILERCRKYNKQISMSYVHILNSKTKKYLAVNLENKKFLFTNKYDDTFYTDEFNIQNKISTYFQLQSITDMMKNILIEDIVQTFVDILLSQEMNILNQKKDTLTTTHLHIG